MAMVEQTEDPEMLAQIRKWLRLDNPVETPDVVQLPEIMDLKAAAPLMSQIVSLRGRAIALDGSRVQRIGGLCLQVLLSACLTWRADGASLSFVSPSTALVEGISLLGASADLPIQA